MVPSRSVRGPLWCGWWTVKSPHLGGLRNVGGSAEAGTPELHRVEAQRAKVASPAVVLRRAAGVGVGTVWRLRVRKGESVLDQNEMQERGTRHWLKMYEFSWT